MIKSDGHGNGTPRDWGIAQWLVSELQWLMQGVRTARGAKRSRTGMLLGAHAAARRRFKG